MFGVADQLNYAVWWVGIMFANPLLMSIYGALSWLASDRAYRLQDDPTTE